MFADAEMAGWQKTMKFCIQAACGCLAGKTSGDNGDNLFFNGRCLPVKNSGMHNVDELEQQVNEGLCMAVFSGTGGSSGAWAAHAAAKRMQELEWKEKDYFELSKAYLQNITQELNRAVIARGKRLGMSCPGISMAALYFSSGNVYACNVGSSQIYLSRASALFQMSRASASSRLLGLSAEEEFRLPHICKNELVRGDKFLICSSSVSKALRGLEIEDILIRNPDPSRCVRELIDRTRSDGGEDSITAIACKIS